MQSPLLSVPFETARRYPERVSHKWKVKDAGETRSYAEFARMIRILPAAF